MSATTATPTISARQLWGNLNTRTDGEGGPQWCTPIIMPTGGLLVMEDNFTTTLSARATFLLPCDSKTLPPDSCAVSNESQVTSLYFHQTPPATTQLLVSASPFMHQYLHRSSRLRPLRSSAISLLFSSLLLLVPSSKLWPDCCQHMANEITALVAPMGKSL